MRPASARVLELPKFSGSKRGCSQDAVSCISKTNIIDSPFSISGQMSAKSLNEHRQIARYLRPLEFESAVNCGFWWRELYGRKSRRRCTVPGSVGDC